MGFFLPWSDHLNNLLNAEVSAAFSTMVDPRTSPDTMHEVYPENDSLSFFQRLLLPSAAWRKLNAAAYIEWADGYFGLCKQPTHELAKSTVDFAESLPSNLWGIARLGAFDCTSVSHKRDLASASVDLLRIALMLQRAFETGGAYPSSLDGLTQLEDPFTQQPYRYAPQADGGYKLWSASINLKDEGGRLPPAGERGSPDYEQGDLVWWVKGPSAAP